MTIVVTESMAVLEIASPTDWRQRVFLVVVALFPLLAPYELIPPMKWGNAWHPFSVLALVVSSGAVAISVLLFFAAASALSSRMTFDAARAIFSYEAVAPIVRRRTQTFALSQLRGVHVLAHSWSEGATYVLCVGVAGKATFESASSSSREEIEGYRALAEAFLARNFVSFGQESHAQTQSPSPSIEATS